MSSASREHPGSSSKYSGFTDTMSGLMLNLCEGRVCVCVCVWRVCEGRGVCVCGGCVRGDIKLLVYYVTIRRWDPL